MSNKEFNKTHIAVIDDCIVGLGYTEGQILQDVQEQQENSNIKWEDFEVFECTASLYHEALMGRIVTSWVFNENNIADVLK